jgi:F-type H+-transporting ATPase subunit gamma
VSDTTASLRRKISGAEDLQSVVRTMRALAAASIGQYENSVRALEDYNRTVELGLSACFRESDQVAPPVPGQGQSEGDTIGAVVFGSDQGLVGQFNDVVADYAIEKLSALRGKPAIWAVGERVHARLLDAGLTVVGLFAVPTAVNAVAPLVGKIQLECESHRTRGKYTRVYVFHNRPRSGALYEPVHQRLLPLDAVWLRGLAEVRWPTKMRPELLGGVTDALHALIREYLFISLFRACAESLASENASRLAAMQRADKNINDLLQHLHATFHRLRQQRIDEELFDVISGYDALAKTQVRVIRADEELMIARSVSSTLLPRPSPKESET